MTTYSKFDKIQRMLKEKKFLETLFSHVAFNQTSKDWVLSGPNNFPGFSITELSQLVDNCIEDGYLTEIQPNSGQIRINIKGKRFMGWFGFGRAILEYIGPWWSMLTGGVVVAFFKFIYALILKVLY